jgi:hypothetical protein
MGIAVLCAIDLESGEEFIFSDNYPGAILLSGLFDFLNGNILIGHNICSFDYRLIQEEVAKHTNDELTVGLLDTGSKRISLASFSEAMFGTFKKMKGADAPIEWQKGNKEKVIEYCMDDVRKTMQLLKHGIDNGHVYYIDKVREKRKIDVDWGKKLSDMSTKVQYPGCFGGFRINKKIWQCSRCHTKVECKGATDAS